MATLLNGQRFLKCVIVLLKVLFIGLAIFKSADGISPFGKIRKAAQNLLHDDKDINYLATLDTADFIRYYGYPCETHEVITEDKYILTIHHIPHGKQDESIEANEFDYQGKKNCSKPAVFLQHGLFSFTGDWFITGPEKALGFILADAGYDVWVGNARGNKYSRDHETLDPNIDQKFWDFSWHEIGYFDLPAMIDYVLSHTKQQKLFFIGHSQGCTAYYVMLSERPEYNDKIRAQYSLSPVAFMKNVRGTIIRIFSYFDKILKLGVDLLNLNELKHDNVLFKYFFHKFCSAHLVADLCARQMFSFVGYNPKQFNHTLLPIIIANYPAGSSMKQIKHFAQEMKSGHFEKYDYGYFRNMLTYGERYPPSYKLNNVKAPIFVFCSGNDYLSSLQDVKRLYWNLPEGNKSLWKVEDKMWNHIDYIWGINAKELVYDKIIESMKTFSDYNYYCHVH